MSDLKKIEQLAHAYADSMTALEHDIETLESAMRTFRKKCLPGIRRAASRASEAKTALVNAIDATRDAFVRPRTRVIHGVRVGVKKSKGTVEWSDEDAVIKRIRSLLPEDQVELLIRVKESVHKPAVYDLSAGDLKRLGIEISGAGDRAIAQLVDSDIERMVDTLLKSDDDATTNTD